MKELSELQYAEIQRPEILIKEWKGDRKTWERWKRQIRAIWKCRERDFGMSSDDVADMAVIKAKNDAFDALLEYELALELRSEIPKPVM
jgi:hypothetical protein